MVNKMKLFLKGFIIGIAKIIPGVSGSMIAVSFNIYDKLINSVTNFFDNKKENLKFLLIIGTSILLSIVFFSNIIRYLINKYYLSMMLLFIGLIVGGTYNFSKNIKYNIKNILIILITILLVTGISLGNISNNYVIKGNVTDYIMFFIGGIIEIFSSIIPGISGTALFMVIGMYDNILMLFSNLFNFNYLINNIGIYLSYGLGMSLSFIFLSILISYILKKYRNLFNTIILGLCISSIILLFIMAFKNSFILIDLIIGILLFFIGLIISFIFDK